jgi:hypothetical protein
MHCRRLVSTFGGLLIVAGCAHTPAFPNAAMSGPPGRLQQEFEREHGAERSWVVCDPDDDLDGVQEISIERTSCYGYCSMYAMTLRNDGSVEYRGVANVPSIGSRKGKIPAAQFRYLARLANEIGFFDLKDSYECAVTDNPTVYTAVVRAGVRKIIRHYAPDRTGPARLKAFEQAIDGVQGWVEWQR